jgi:hypothetical protein
MKIDKILFISDSNINYLSFWNSISKYYNKRFNLNCKLFFLGEKNSENEQFLSEEFGEVEIIKPIEDIPVIIQALWGKFWFTQTEPDTNWLIGDIDLYLLNKEYFEKSMDLIPEGSYGHINANGYKSGDWWNIPKVGIPGYFHCGSGKTFKEYLQLSDYFEDDCRYIYDSKKYGILYNGMIQNENNAPQRVKDKDSYGFICCEEQLTTERLIPHKDKVISITYPITLQRLETPYALQGLSTPENFDLVSIFDNNYKNYYIDFHCPRPYTIFGEQIEKIISNYE